MSKLNIAIAQINCVIGDFPGNVKRIIAAAQAAKARGAHMLLAPELALCGYPPEDLLYRDSFFAASERALAELAQAVPDLVMIIGHPERRYGKRYNAASVLRDGQITETYRKFALPNYEVFDEKRYFDAGDQACVIAVEGVKVGINICEDIWSSVATAAAKAAGAELIVAPNASPFNIGKQLKRYAVLRDRIRETGLPFVYCNWVGGQDELVFDGASCALNREGEVTHQLPAFEEALEIVTYENSDNTPGTIILRQTVEADVYDALCVGVRDYVGKNGFPGVLLGLSGGIDSALTLAVAVDALGADKVRAVMMPSQYTADISWIDSREMVKILGVRYDEIAIKPMFDAYLATLADEFKGLAQDATEENIQARIRGTLLMALSNKFGSIVLTTGNKSEMATGYCTLYGDMAGGFAVLKDVAKTLVFRLARYRNTLSHVIPERIITRPPSAELRPDQKDQDSLPPYEALDAIMEAYMQENKAPDEIVALGYKRADVERVCSLLKINEYKRRQAPVGIRITHRGFGKDWRYPITNKFRDW